MNSRRCVVVLTALNLEYEAVQGHLDDIRRLRPLAGTRFEAGAMRGAAGEVVLALTGVGNRASAIIAERAIHEFSPVAIMFVGVAGRLRPSVALGDVVVATHVYAYQGAAARDDGMKSRPRVWELDHGIEQAVHQVVRHAGRGRARVHFGPIASGDVLHDAQVSEPLRWIKEHYDDAVAIEMEGAGFAEAGHLNAVPSVVIRGISDHADGTKASADGRNWQPRAARNAAQLAVALAAELIKEANDRAGTGRDASQVHNEVSGGTVGAQVAGTVHGGVHTTFGGRS